MLRKTLTTLSLIGLLLSVGLWAASYFHFSYHAPDPHDDKIFVSFGRLIWSRGMGGSPGWGFEHFVGFHTEWAFEATFEPWLILVVPLWMPTSAFLTILWVSPIHRRRKRKKLGLCLNCGYNLRGLTELRCPECNTPFEKCSAKP